MTTLKIYKSRIKTFLREINEEFNISNMQKIKDEHFNEIIQQKIDLFHAGDTAQASNIKTTLAALNHLNLGIQKTRFYRHSEKFRIGDIEKARKLLKEEGVRRKSEYSQVRRASEEEAETVLKNIQTKGYDTDTRKIAAQVAYISLKSGGRITNILGLKKKDFRWISPERGEITFHRDKGGLTRRVEVDGDLIEFLERISNEKLPNQEIFDLRRKNGQKKSKKQMREEISKIIREAAKEFETTKTVTINKKGKEIETEIPYKFTTHSFRKAFALKRMYEYATKLTTKKQIEDYLEERFRENKKLEDKYYNLLKRINSKRTTEREITREEVITFLTSADLGHFRLDVIRMYYCSFEEMREYYRI